MIIVLSLLALMVILFSLDRFPPDTIVLVALILLVLTKILTPSEAFAGFGSDFIIMLASIFIISASLQHNGVVEYFSQKLTVTRSSNYFLTITIIMLSVGFLSAFMNNTTVAAIMVLPVIGMSKKINQPASKYLMPMAFASLVGGTCTLLGTSTNIAGNNFLIENGYKAISLFEFAPIGITLLLVCTLFFGLFGKKFLPVREEETDGGNDNTVILKKYYSEINIESNSKLIGKKGTALETEEINVLKIKKGINNSLFASESILESGDVLCLYATQEAIHGFYNNYGLFEQNGNKTDNSTSIAELIVLPTSFIVNSSLKDNDIIEKTGLFPIAIYRKGHLFVKNFNEIIIKPGDMISVTGEADDINKLRFQNDFIVNSETESAVLPNLKKGFISLAIFAAAIILNTLNVLPMSISFLMAVLISLSFGVLPSPKIYSKVDWKLIVLIGGMTAFGIAIKKTGTDTFLSNFILEYGPSNPIALLFVFMMLTVLLTQPMSNAAAALVVLPIAIQTAISLHANPRSFAIAIILSASISMVTPFEPALLLVLNPGKYKISDFFKIGGLLTFISLFIILVFIYFSYGL